MKLRRLTVSNARSFLESADLVVDGDLSIIIGPNGGGKTNLLDILFITLRRTLLRPYHFPLDGNPPRTHFRLSDTINAIPIDKHDDGSRLAQLIEIEVEVTKSDVTSITYLSNNRDSLTAFYQKQNYAAFDLNSVNTFLSVKVTAGDRYVYTIQDGSVQSIQDDASSQFFSYLQNFEGFAYLRASMDRETLPSPFLYLPINRSIGDTSSTVSLSNFDEPAQKRGVDASWSRNVASIQALAIGRIARRKRRSLELPSSPFYEEYETDQSLIKMTEALQILGYGWSMETTNADKNEYELRLTRFGRSYNLSRASSGEKELINYILAIYGLNIRDALIIIDEPEVHLHPRWQATLLRLFERLAKDTGNQFVMATHSPAFVSPASISYVSRVFLDGRQSRIVQVANKSLPEQKHLMSIVNSHNNERVFFADRVILVEGISDRLFFEKIIAHFSGGTKSDRLIEVVSVGGKTLFATYELLLKAMGVEYQIIADLDYVADLDSAIDAMFKPDAKSIKAAVFDASSLDGTSFIKAVDELAGGGPLSDFIGLWEYIKAHRRKLRSDLAPEEKAILETFIQGCRAGGVHILSEGSLEDYLPNGFQAKGLDKLIRFLENDSFWDHLPVGVKSELETIASALLA